MKSIDRQTFVTGSIFAILLVATPRNAESVGRSTPREQPTVACHAGPWLSWRSVDSLSVLEHLQKSCEGSAGPTAMFLKARTTLEAPPDQQAELDKTHKAIMIKADGKWVYLDDVDISEHSSGNSNFNDASNLVDKVNKMRLGYEKYGTPGTQFGEPTPDPKEAAARYDRVTRAVYEFQGEGINLATLVHRAGFVPRTHLIVDATEDGKVILAGVGQNGGMERKSFRGGRLVDE